MEVFLHYVDHPVLTGKRETWIRDGTIGYRVVTSILVSSTSTITNDNTCNHRHSSAI